MKLQWKTFLAFASMDFAFSYGGGVIQNNHQNEQGAESVQDQGSADVGILSRADTDEGLSSSLRNRELSDPYFCQGRYACRHSINLVLGNNTCIGEYACYKVGSGSRDNRGSLTAGNDSCNGHSACNLAGWRDGTVIVGNKACLGPNACMRTGQGSSFRAGDGSCEGWAACESSRDATTIGQSTCKGSQACYGLLNAIVGDSSCIHEYACKGAGGFLRAEIGSESCIGKYACSWAGSGRGDFFVGSGSCQCDGCCKNLKAGSVIGDCQCNSLSDGCFDQPFPVNLPGSLCQLQELTFNQSTKLLGLTQSNSTVDLSQLVQYNPAERQELAFDQTTNRLSLNNGTGVVDLSRLEQELTFDNSTMRLGLTASNYEVDLSALAPRDFQNLTFDELTSLLGLTNSDIKINLSSLVNDDQNELQDMLFNNVTNQLTLTNSTKAVDLSRLDQKLTFDPKRMRLGLTGSSIGVNLASLVQQRDYQNLTFDDSKNLLGLTNSESTVDLSSLVSGSSQLDFQDLVFDNVTNELTLTDSTEAVDLSILVQDLKLENNKVEISAGGNGVASKNSSSSSLNR